MRLDDALFDQGHVDATLGQFERRGDADDAAADDGDRGLLGDFRVGIDVVGRDGHDGASVDGRHFVARFAQKLHKTLVARRERMAPTGD